MKLSLLCLCIALSACVVLSSEELPKNNAKVLKPVAHSSQFFREPEYYPTKDDSSFAEVAADQVVPSVPMIPYMPWDGMVGSQGYTLRPGNSFAPGYYFPPTTPYRFPSFPYDNPTYSAFPSMFNVPLPPAWRSDAFNVNSDGARYMENMQKYDYYPPQFSGAFGTLGAPGALGAAGAVGAVGAAPAVPAPAV